MQKSKARSSIHLLIATSVFFAIGVFGVLNAQANDLQGLEETALQAAVEIWLQDNDRDSLPTIATLAADGNIAARLFLSRIEVTDQGPSDFVNGLSRKQRVELFRSSSGKGIFRPTWMKSEKEAGNQVASILLDSTNTIVSIDAIRKLYEIGETEAAYDLIREAAGNGSQEQKQELSSFLPEDSELMPYLRALQNPQAAISAGHTALQLAIDGGNLQGPEADTGIAAYFVEYGYQTGVQNSDFNQSNYYYDDLASWIAVAPVTAPIATLCRRVCGEEIRDCAITTFGLVGGYYKAIKFDSPMQSLIEQSRFVTSDRAVGMVLRRISFARPASASNKLLISDSQLEAKSACLAGAVAEVRAGRK
jgi:hypothetical protein